jgi:hypothetical protein
MRGWLAVGLVSVLLLSGCTQKSPPSGSGTVATKASASGSTTGAAGFSPSAGTATATSGQNHAPTGGITANQTAGKSPLTVLFTLDATDTDGDKLSFTVDFDGNGTIDSSRANATFPTQVNHTYVKAGLYNITYTLTDGRESVSYKAMVNVTAAGGGAPVVIAGSISQYGLCGVPPGDDDAHPIDAALVGATYTLTPASLYPWWWIGEGSSDPTVSGDNTGKVPEGTTSVHICVDKVGVAGVSPGTDYVLTITPA